MRTFRNRLLALLIGLVAVTQTVTLVAVLARTESDVRQRAAEHLASAGSVLKRLLDFRTSQLDSALTVLAGDFGFRDAVSSGDRPTIRSAIENHGERIHSDIALLLDTDGRVISGTGSSLKFDNRRLPELIANYSRMCGRASFILLAGKPYQIVTVPVRAPTIIAWVTMGFALDSNLGNELRGIINVDVSFVAQGQGDERFVASTLSAAVRDDLLRSLDAVVPNSQPITVDLRQDPYLSYALSLPALGGEIRAVLQESLHASMAPYRLLKLTMSVIGGVALGFAVLTAIIWGRNATRPIDRLVQAARRIESGNYVETVHVEGAREFERLAATFNRMQRGIAEREARIVNQAHYDALTGLPSRAFAERHLAAILESRAGDGSIALVLINIREFRDVIVSFGHQVGDDTLTELAQRCLQIIHERDFVARVATDQFLFILDGCTLAEALLRCEELAVPFRQGIGLEQISVRLDVNTGICVAPEHGTSAPELLRRVDIALQDAKDRQIGTAVYASSGDEGHRRRLALSAELRDAIERRQLSVVYQPKVNMRTRQVKSVEALLRWHHPVFGVVSPSEFVPIAERTGLIKSLTRWVITESIVQVAAWRKRGVELDVAVNLSASDIVDPNLADEVLQQLRSIDLPASSLVLEITESSVLRDPVAATQHIQRLRAAGVRFAIDDFGTGYSSLTQLRRLPVDEVKIDRSFVMEASTNQDDAAIVKSIIELGHAMNLAVVAEGIETSDAWTLLDDLGCDYAQGYFISKPLTAVDLFNYIGRINLELSHTASSTGLVRVLKHGGSHSQG